MVSPDIFNWILAMGLVRRRGRGACDSFTGPPFLFIRFNFYPATLLKLNSERKPELT
jgi:hypothetical protein